MSHLFNEKILNKEKLLASDFFDRFTGFAERFDAMRNVDNSSLIQRWIKNEEYVSIQYFLLMTPYETILPVSMHQFISMSPEEFSYMQEIYTQISALLDEKRTLYNEFMSFYE